VLGIGNEPQLRPAMATTGGGQLPRTPVFEPQQPMAMQGNPQGSLPSGATPKAPGTTVKEPVPTVSTPETAPKIPTTEPDVGLSNRGYKPQPGERSTTKEQWKAQSARERFDAGVSRERAKLSSSSEKLNNTYKVTEQAENVIQSLKTTGHLPPEYVTKATAQASGWAPGKALGNHVTDGQIGGDIFRNQPSAPGQKPLLPDVKGRTWHEADIGLSSSMKRSKQPGTRLLYSSDGELYITTDHYENAHRIGTWK
jgi:ribonuclease